MLVFTQGLLRGSVTLGVRRGIRGGLFVAFLIVERTADNPLVPFSVFDNRNRVTTFAAVPRRAACC